MLSYERRVRVQKVRIQTTHERTYERTNKYLPRLQVNQSACETRSETTRQWLVHETLRCGHILLVEHRLPNSLCSWVQFNSCSRQQSETLATKIKSRTSTNGRAKFFRSRTTHGRTDERRTDERTNERANTNPNYARTDGRTNERTMDDDV